MLSYKICQNNQDQRRTSEGELSSLSSFTPVSHQPFSPSAVCFLEHYSKAVKLIHAKTSNSILIEMSAITSYHQQYANVSPCVFQSPWGFSCGNSGERKREGLNVKTGVE